MRPIAVRLWVDVVCYATPQGNEAMWRWADIKYLESERSAGRFVSFYPVDGIPGALGLVDSAPAQMGTSYYVQFVHGLYRANVEIDTVNSVVAGTNDAVT